MKHVTAIKKLLDDGQVDEAQTALENLLALGPSNLEALKLKALIFNAEGRFQEEEKVWLKIIKVDQEDEDAIRFIERRHFEDREHFYFTDDLPGGGRRFLAYPRALTNIAVVALAGCVSFLLLHRVSDKIPLLQNITVIYLCFLTLVILPWVAILFSFARSIRSIDVSDKGLSVNTRMRNQALPWREIKKICLAYADNPTDPDLRLVVIPLSEEEAPIEVDFNDESSPIRARTHLINEISLYYGPIDHSPRSNINSKLKSILYR